MDILSTWHLIRASGIIAYALLSISIFSGILCSASFLQPRSRAFLLHLHEASSRWSLWLVLAHAALLTVDSYAGYTPVAVLLPLLGPYRPWPVILGSIAAWLMLLILLAFDLRPRLDQKFWRMLHGLNVLVYVAATLHGIWSGTDTSQTMAAAMYWGSASALAVLVVLRYGTAGNAGKMRKTLKGAK